MSKLVNNGDFDLRNSTKLEKRVIAGLLIQRLFKVT